ncbi:MAG: DsrE/DsrF/DrsH-like family protein [Rhodospirillales bacterium]|jgi:peroxiredoxin family protein|nr:DsrE/DsrF/DrsH-like family protein [Rhodospirillales bacterium]MDP6882833.1 DsrE/DsrF/DrsH-like family protein [Rhodospirillales bacterium]
MPSDSPRRTIDKLSVVVFSGHFDKVHYALSLAAAAAATDTPATLFFTMGALRALQAPDADGAPAWRGLPLSEGAGDGGTRDDDFGARGVATFEELLAAAAEMGVRFMACEMGLRAEGLAAGDLRHDLAIETVGAVTFLNDASKHGTVLFV